MRALKNLCSKFVRTMLLVAGIIGISTFAVVLVLSEQASSQLSSSVRTYIVSKAELLVSRPRALSAGEVRPKATRNERPSAPTNLSA